MMLNLITCLQHVRIAEAARLTCRLSAVFGCNKFQLQLELHFSCKTPATDRDRLKWERPLTTCKLLWLENGNDPQ